jgi:hypothetical protein
VLKDGIYTKKNICPKDERGMIAEAVLIAEDRSTEKGSVAGSAAPYLSIDAFY